jgi:hypothetical protein
MNNIDTLTTQTTTFITDLIRTNFLPQIVRYINEKKNDDILTVDELSKILYLPYTKISNQSIKNNLYINSNKKCIWEFKRGKYRGEVCNKQTVENSDYCSSCIKRVTFNKKQNINQNLSITNNISLNNLPASGCGEIPALDAKPYDKARGLYKCDFNDYIFRFEKSETQDFLDMYILGKINQEEQLIKLSDEEFEQAVEDGYLIDRDYEL